MKHQLDYEKGNSEEVLAMLRENGFEVSDPRFPALDAARESLRHLVLGCRKVSYWVWDPGSQRAVYRGMICSTCDKEYPG